MADRLPIDRAVLFVTGEYPPLRGGVGDYTARLAEALTDHGWSVTVVTRPSPDRTATSPAIRVTTGWGWRLREILQELYAQGWRGIVHLQYQAGAFDLQGRIALLPQLAHPFPVVTTFHDLRVPYLFPKAGPLRHLVLRWLARTSAAVVVTNPEDERAVRRWDISGARLWRIPIGSNLPAPRDPRAARQRLGLPRQQPLVAFFGFRQPEKGLETLIAAIARLPEPRPLLVLLGGDRPDTPGARAGDATAYRDIAAVPLVDLGYRPAQDVADLLAAADVVALPFRDGASLRHGSLIAALASGAALVTTRPADPTLLFPLRDGEHCCLVPPDDPTALAQALAGLLADPTRRDQLRAGARTVAAAFAWERIAQRHAQLYEVVRQWSRYSWGD
ncbi:glycosyltransferase [Thermomicrobium sp. 4228-Ro]|uniref:glycosyltransferase n=1 Tax=Thermomicrobium sp. 4228-Ro TaxID=2993937 RepID=UPI0022495877|nr:glycosyltransferase [Thermomicrobium sp. 4228-Ro]MCX2727138.1 glycosyltransferase [Thermomicrobium sp. 4228-Ro]